MSGTPDRRCSLQSRYFWRGNSLGRGGQGISGKHCELVGDGPAEAGGLAGCVDRLRDARRRSGAPRSGGVDRQPGCKGACGGKGAGAALRLPHTGDTGKAGPWAALYATGQERFRPGSTARRCYAAAFPPWKQMPWKKFVRAEVTDKLSAGANTIAIETVHYVANPNGMAEGRCAADDRNAGGGVRGRNHG